MEHLEELRLSLADEWVWKDIERVKAINQAMASEEAIVVPIEAIDQCLQESLELMNLAEAEHDQSLLEHILTDLEAAKAQLAELEFKTMFQDPNDPNHAYVDIQAGSGGTEAQDWAEMLLRMYLKWGERHKFDVKIMELSAGEVAGIKSATLLFSAAYAYGWLKSETGVHRLVRKSPFDSGNRRHTSFAAVFVAPEIDDSITIDIQPQDIRIDTYRAGGAGGQHVNRTDSAVRITHTPTNTVVQCQSDRSQHKNKAQAMKQLRAKLYELELQKQQAAKQLSEQSKSEIGWGHQIRSYVLDQARIKDLRTGVEVGHTGAVLDGDLDIFMEAFLKQLADKSAKAIGD